MKMDNVFAVIGALSVLLAFAWLGTLYLKVLWLLVIHAWNKI